MAITNGYATLAELKEWIEADVVVDARAERAVEASSRWIDDETQRSFWQQVGASRSFEATTTREVNLGPFNDLVSISTLKVDDDGDGTFEATWSAADYQLLPLSPGAAPETRPFTDIEAVGSLRFPVPCSGRRARVQVTGTWGWPAIPHAVNQACLLQAARLYKRRNSPEGVGGFGSDFGPIRLSARPDPDALELIAPYCYYPVAVA